ncbi:MAG: hypothetical protein Phog2KO_30170 [Phototrophicaceae bacterium]
MVSMKVQKYAKAPNLSFNEVYLREAIQMIRKWDFACVFFVFSANSTGIDPTNILFLSDIIGKRTVSLFQENQFNLKISSTRPKKFLCFS